MEIPSDMFYIFHVWEDTQSLNKNTWNRLCNWNLMIFIDIWPFGPSPGPQGAGPKKCAVAHPIHVSNSHSKFGWISSNGLGGDSVTDRQMDRRTDGGDCNIPDAFLKMRGDNQPTQVLGIYSSVSIRCPGMTVKYSSYILLMFKDNV